MERFNSACMASKTASVWAAERVKAVRRVRMTSVRTERRRLPIGAQDAILPHLCWFKLLEFEKGVCRSEPINLHLPTGGMAARGGGPGRRPSFRFRFRK